MAMAVGWVKALVIAIGTTTAPNRSIAVGSSKTGINGNLLHLAAQFAAQIGSKIVIVESLLAHSGTKITKSCGFIK